jgi:hypothetical protein
MLALAKLPRPEGSEMLLAPIIVAARRRSDHLLMRDVPSLSS